MKVVILGSVFTLAERRFNVDLKEALEKASKGCAEVILPQEQAEKFITDGKIDYRGIVNQCISDAVGATIAIAILDGSQIDDGTCIEIGFRKGYARYLQNLHKVGEPYPFFWTFGVRTDFRLAGEVNNVKAIIDGVCDKIIYFPSFNEDINELAKILWNTIFDYVHQS